MSARCCDAQDGWSALTIAVYRGAIDMVEALLITNDNVHGPTAAVNSKSRVRKN